MPLLPQDLLAAVSPINSTKLLYPRLYAIEDGLGSSGGKDCYNWPKNTQKTKKYTKRKKYLPSGSSLLKEDNTDMSECTCHGGGSWELCSEHVCLHLH